MRTLGRLGPRGAGTAVAALSGAIVRLCRQPRIAPSLLMLIRLVPSRPLRTALQRSFSWEIADGLRSGVEISTAAGRMAVDSTELLGRVVAIAGEWEPHVTAAFRERLGPGDICVDVGAHIGYYTLLASKLVGPDGRVYAFEPSPACYRVLADNLARIRATNVTALNVAAGSSEGPAVLHVAPGANPTNSSLSPRILESPHSGRAEEYTPVEVGVRTVDSVVPPDADGRVRMIKVDVEGYEVEALRGVERILSAGAPIALIVELSPAWSLEDPAVYVEDLCRRHALRPYRLRNEYSLDGYFPARIEPPVRLDRIPRDRCDLLLERL